MKRSIIITALLGVLTLTNCAKGNDARPDDAKTDDSEEALVDRIVNSDIPVLVDFWAAWCMPCRILDPVIDELEKEYEGRVRFVKVDVDVHRGIAAYFRINSVPSVYLIENKTVRVALPGVRHKQAYVDAIENVLKPAAERNAAPPAGKRR